MRAMILGAGGMLGHDLVATAPRWIKLFTFTRATLDITDHRVLNAAVAETRPDVILNAAGYTLVDRAETERELALKVNADAVRDLGRVAAARNVRVIHFSTDYVFDGEADSLYMEDAPPNPLSAYGLSKLAGERELQSSGAPHLVIRTQWLFGVNGRSFPRTMWERARARRPTRVVNDQFGRPTYALDLAEATWRLVRAGAAGLFHVANSGITTWFGLAQRLFGAAGVPELVAPCATTEYPTPATRPRNAVLDTSRAEELLGTPLPHWTDAVDRFVRFVLSEAA